MKKTNLRMFGQEVGLRSKICIFASQAKTNCVHLLRSPSTTCTVPRISFKRLFSDLIHGIKRWNGGGK